MTAPPQVDTDADREALERLAAAWPMLTGIETADNAIGLPEEVLLHAGPPFASPDDVPRPIMNSAVHAAMLAGLADTRERARALLLSGQIRLEPAQDRGVVTPLAMVVCGLTPLQCVSDGEGFPTAYSPVNDGNLYPSRVGQETEEVFQELRWMSVAVADRIDAALSRPIPLMPLARAGLEGGDDLHGRCAASSAAFAAELRDRLPSAIGPAVGEFLDASGGLFLNLWMAACKCLMTAGEGVRGASLITAAAGNGVEVGIQISGLPGRWFTAPAAAPSGALPPGMDGRALGAIGDSAVVEGLGTGAMAWHLSPAQMQALGPFLPDDSASRIAALTGIEHSAFAGLNVPLGVTARRVSALGKGPVVGLGIIDRDGTAGRIGGGIYDMPVAPFLAALDALNA